MKPTHCKLRCALLALAAALAAAPALAGDDCDTPVERWQSRAAVHQMAAQQGWRVQRLKIDDGCYKVRGTDAQGRSFKAKINPETLQVIKFKQRERERRREHEHAPHGGQDAKPADGNTPSSLFTPGTTPRGQVE